MTEVTHSGNTYQSECFKNRQYKRKRGIFRCAGNIELLIKQEAYIFPVSIFHTYWFIFLFPNHPYHLLIYFLILFFCIFIIIIIIILLFYFIFYLLYSFLLGVLLTLKKKVFQRFPFNFNQIERYIKSNELRWNNS